MPTRKGSIRLFQLFGITVYLHWAWFFAVAYFVHQARGYSSLLWSVLECFSLFLIVLIHEFGHQLACRSVGGKTHDIVLWVLGGVAYVSPPQRPGATLWSIAAGPLVNVLLFPLFGILLVFGKSAGWEDANPNAFNFVFMLFSINVVLLVFNMLPIYPLDGGQILRSLLWFVFGRAKSLMIASIIGFIGVAALIGLAVLQQNLILGGICLLIVLNCWGGLMQARALARVANAPRHDGFACPVCKVAPPRGAFWVCGKCRKAFDTFETQGVCPNCGTQFAVTFCPECGNLRPMSEWAFSSNVLPKII
jgi:Zn-dependent protease